MTDSKITTATHTLGMLFAKSIGALAALLVAIVMYELTILPSWAFGLVAAVVTGIVGTFLGYFVLMQYGLTDSPNGIRMPHVE